MFVFISRLKSTVVLIILVWYWNPYFANGQESNREKIELLYRGVTVTTTSQAPYTGATNSRSTFFNIPQVRINGGQEFNFRTHTMEPYFKDCPPAMRALKNYDQSYREMKKARRRGVFLGAGLVLAGFVGAIEAEQNSQHIPIWAPFALGFGGGVTSILLGRKKGLKKWEQAERHMQQSIINYNQLCYEAALKGDQQNELNQVDSIDIDITKTTKVDSLKDDGVQYNYQDDFKFVIANNAPDLYKFLSLRLDFLDIGGGDYHGFTMRGGLNFHWLANARFYVDLNYHQAYVDNLYDVNIMGGTNTTAHLNPIVEPTDYQRANEWSGTMGYAFSGKYKKELEKLHLRRIRMERLSVNQVVQIEADVWKSWSARVGITGYQSVIHNAQKFVFNSSTLNNTLVIIPALNETFTTQFGEIENALAMLSYQAISVGISRRTFHNLEIEFFEPIRGVRKKEAIVEFYADAIFAPKIALGDLHMKYSFSNPNDWPDAIESAEFVVSPDETPLRKIGWRVGYRNYSHKGLNSRFEIGQRPGMQGTVMFYGLVSLGISLGKKQ